MQGKRLIRNLSLSNFLSYGDGGVSIDLEPLNVLVGPNASGKSNLIEALAVLRATATDLAAVIREGGGIREYLYKAASQDVPFKLEAVVNYRPKSQPLRYQLSLTHAGQKFELADEAILGNGTIYRYRPSPRLGITSAESGTRVFQRLQRGDLKTDQSILSQRKDPDRYPELTYIADQFASIAIFQEWSLGRATPARVPQRADLPSDFLLEDGSNLGLVLNEMQHRSDTRSKILQYLERFYESAQYISTKIHSGTVQIFIDEGRGEPIPATRLSDGTLRYLSLLAILCHPSPPPLVCIEEPELGMHPDVLPTIAELLVDAAQRTQLVVTTHSDVLVSAFSDTPEAIVVCEPSIEGTRLRRLDRKALGEWLEKYSLGEIWRMGEIGGTRW